MGANNNRSRGKNTERYLADRLGAQRLGLLGKDDLRNDSFSIEVKNRVKSTVHNFMRQAVRNCPAGKVPLVIVHEHQGNHGDDLVCIKLRDWESYMGEMK